MIDSRDFLNAKKLAETQVLLPPGPRIAFAGGADCNDHQRIWDDARQGPCEAPDMVLLHGAGPKGAERIAACWADNRKVPQVAFKPDWSRHKNAAPFKRNDVMLEALPIGVIVFPGSGIVENLADKARKMGIPVWRFSKSGDPLRARRSLLGAPNASAPQWLRRVNPKSLARIDISDTFTKYRRVRRIFR